jgi:hypothetical protein
MITYLALKVQIVGTMSHNFMVVRLEGEKSGEKRTQQTVTTIESMMHFVFVRGLFLPTIDSYPRYYNRTHGN